MTKDHHLQGARLKIRRTFLFYIVPMIASWAAIWLAISIARAEPFYDSDVFMRGVAARLRTGSDHIPAAVLAAIFGLSAWLVWGQLRFRTQRRLARLSMTTCVVAISAGVVHAAVETATFSTVAGAISRTAEFVALGSQSVLYAYGIAVLSLILINSILPALAATWCRDVPYLCSRCRYDLRGITSSVCPECGMTLRMSACSKRSS